MVLKRKCLSSYPIRRAFSWIGESSVKCGLEVTSLCSVHTPDQLKLCTLLLNSLIHVLELCTGDQVPRNEVCGGAGRCCISTCQRTWLAEYWNSVLKVHYRVVCDNLMTCCTQHYLKSALLFPRMVWGDLSPICLVSFAVMTAKGKMDSYRALRVAFFSRGQASLKKKN